MTRHRAAGLVTLDDLPIGGGHPQGPTRHSRETKADRASKPPLERRPGPRGWLGTGGGRASLVEAPPEWRATTVQVCGLWPWVVASGTPMVRVP